MAYLQIISDCISFANKIANTVSRRLDNRDEFLRETDMIIKDLSNMYNYIESLGPNNTIMMPIGIIDCYECLQSANKIIVRGRINDTTKGRVLGLLRSAKYGEMECTISTICIL